MPLQGSAKDPGITDAGVPTALTDNSGGTAGDTLADVPGTYTETIIANNFASLAGKVNEIITLLNQMSEGRKK